MRALELNESLAEAHNSLAYWKLNYGWDWKGAEEEFRRSLQLNPGYANAHHWYAHLLMSAGRTDEALAESKKALELDQLSPIMNAHLGWHYFFARQYEQALDQLSKTLELDPAYGLAFWYTGWAYEQTGKPEKAIEQMLRARELLKGNLIVEADLAHAYGIAGKQAEARRILAELRSLSSQRYVNPYELALIHIGLGEEKQAFQALDQALRDRSDLMIYLRRDPRMDPIRPDPRFEELVRKVEIPQPQN
jgi:tetratricopeptide (TPR) repeat protein